ncbi:MAG: hypothetical protein ACI33S_04200 [Bacilli bacterium]
MKCVNCEYELSDGSKECPKCGYVNGIGQHINKKNIAIAGGSTVAAGLSAVGISKLFKDNNNLSAKSNPESIDKIGENFIADTTIVEDTPKADDNFLIDELFSNEDIIVEDTNIDLSAENDASVNKSKNYNDGLEINENTNSTKKVVSKNTSSNDDKNKVDVEKKEDKVVDDTKEKDTLEKNELEESEKNDSNLEDKEAENLEDNETENLEDDESENFEDNETENLEDNETENYEQVEEDEISEDNIDNFDGYGNIGAIEEDTDSSNVYYQNNGNIDFYFNYFCVNAAIQQLKSISQCSYNGYNMQNLSSNLASIFNNQANNIFTYGNIISDKQGNINLKTDFNAFYGDNGFVGDLASSLDKVWNQVTEGLEQEEIEENIKVGLVERLSYYESSAEYSEEQYLSELAETMKLIGLGDANSIEEIKTMIGEYSTVAADYAQRAADETQKADYDYKNTTSYKVYQSITGGLKLTPEEVSSMEKERLDRVAAGLWVGLGNGILENGLLYDNKTTLQDFSIQQLEDGLKDENGNYINPEDKTDSQKQLELVIYGQELGKAEQGNEEVLGLITNAIGHFYDKNQNYYPGDYIYDLLQQGVIQGYYNDNGIPIDFETRYEYIDPENKSIEEVKDAQGYKFINWNVDMYHSIVESRTSEQRLIVNQFEEQFMLTYDYYDDALPNYNIALELFDYDKQFTGNDSEEVSETPKVLTAMGDVVITESPYTSEEYNEILDQVKKAKDRCVQAEANLDTFNLMWCSEYSGVNTYQVFINDIVKQITEDNEETIFDKETNKLDYNMLFDLFEELKASDNDLSSYLNTYIDLVNNSNYEDYIYKEAKQKSDVEDGKKLEDIKSLKYTKSIDENQKEYINIGEELAASLSCSYGNIMTWSNSMDLMFDYNKMRVDYANVYGEYLEAKANYEYQRDYVDPYDWTGSENDRSQALKDEQERYKGLLDQASAQFGDDQHDYIYNKENQDKYRMAFIEKKNEFAKEYINNNMFKLSEFDEEFVEEYTQKHYNNEELENLNELLNSAYEDLQKCQTYDELQNTMGIISSYNDEKTNKILMLTIELAGMTDNNFQGRIASCNREYNEYDGSEYICYYDKDGNAIYPSSQEIAVFMSLNSDIYNSYKYFLTTNEKDYVKALNENSEYMRKGLSYIYNNNPDEFDGYFKSMVEAGSFSLARNSFAVTKQRYEDDSYLTTIFNLSDTNFFGKAFNAVGDFGWTLWEAAKAGGNQIKYGFVNFADADGIKNRADYHNMLVGNYLSQERDTKFLYHTYNIGTSIVNMAPTIVLSALIPGVGAYLGSAVMFVTSAGNATEGFMQDGMDKEWAIIFGVISGIAEVGLQAVLGSKFLGGVQVKVVKEALAKALGATVKGTLKTFAYEQFIEALGEGFEEFSQEIIGTWLSNFGEFNILEYNRIKDIIDNGDNEALKELFYKKYYENDMEEKNNSFVSLDSQVLCNSYLSFDNWLKLNQEKLDEGTLYEDWVSNQKNNSENYFKWYFENREKIDWNQAIQAGLYGAATSLVTGAPSSAVHTVSYINTKNTDTYSNFIQNRMSQSLKNYYNLPGNMVALSNYAKSLKNAGITDVNIYTQQIMSDPRFDSIYESYTKEVERSNENKLFNKTDPLSKEEIALNMFTEIVSTMNATEIAGLSAEHVIFTSVTVKTNEQQLNKINNKIERFTKYLNNLANNTEMTQEEIHKETQRVKEKLTTLKQSKKNLEKQIRDQKKAIKIEASIDEIFDNLSDYGDDELKKLLDEILKSITTKSDSIQSNNNKIKEQEAIIESVSHGYVASNGKPATKAQKAQITSKAQKIINQLKAENESLALEISDLESEVSRYKMYDLFMNPEQGLDYLSDSEFNYFISKASPKMLDLFSNEIVARIGSIDESNLQDFYAKISKAFTNAYKLDLISNIDNVTDEAIKSSLLDSVNEKITPEKFYEGIFELYSTKYMISDLFEMNNEKPGLIESIKNKIKEAKQSKEEVEKNKKVQREKLVENIDKQLVTEIESIRKTIEELPKHENAKAKDKIEQTQRKINNLEAKIEQFRNMRIEILNTLKDSSKSISDLSNGSFNYLVNSMSQENLTLFSKEIMSKLDVLSDQNFATMIENMSIDTIYKYRSKLAERIKSIEEKNIGLKEKTDSILVNSVEEYAEIKYEVEEATGEKVYSDLNIIQLIKNKIDSIKLKREERLAKISEVKGKVNDNIDNRINELNAEIKKIDESNKTSEDKVRKESQRKAKYEEEIKSLESIKGEINEVLSDSKVKLSKLSKEAFNYLYENMTQEEIQLFAKDIIKRLEILTNENFKDFVEKLDEETVNDYESSLIRRAASIIKDASNRNYITELIKSKSNIFKETSEKIVKDTNIETSKETEIKSKDIAKATPAVEKILENIKSNGVSTEVVSELTQKGSLSELTEASLNTVLNNVSSEVLNNEEVLAEVMEVINTVKDTVLIGIISNLNTDNVNKNKAKLETRVNNVVSDTLRLFTQTMLIKQLNTDKINLSPNEINNENVTELLENNMLPNEVIENILNDSSLSETDKIKLVQTTINSFIRSETKILEMINKTSKELIDKANDIIGNVTSKTDSDLELIKTKLISLQNTIESRIKQINDINSYIESSKISINSNIDEISKSYININESISSCLAKIEEITKSTEGVHFIDNSEFIAEIEEKTKELNEQKTDDSVRNDESKIKESLESIKEMKSNIESSSEISESLKAEINEKLIKLETEYNDMLNKFKVDTPEIEIVDFDGVTSSSANSDASIEIDSKLNEINDSVNELILEINSQETNIENIENLKSTISEKIKNSIAEILSNYAFINEISQTFKDFSKSLEGLKNLPAKTKNALVNLANSIQTKLNSIIENLKSTKPQIDPKEIASVKEELSTFKQTLSDVFKIFFDTKTDDLMSMENDILGAEFEEIETVSMFAKITKSLTNFFSNLQESINLQNMFDKLDGINLSINNIFNISDSLSNLDEFIKSVDSKTTEFESKVKNYVNSLIESVKNAFLSKSDVVHGFNNTENGSIVANHFESIFKLTTKLFDKSNLTISEKTNLSTKLKNLGKQIVDYITGLYQGTIEFSKQAIDKFVDEFKKLGDSINKDENIVKIDNGDTLSSHTDNSLNENHSDENVASLSHVDKVLNANYSDVNDALTELFKYDKSVESTVKVIESFMSSGNFGMFDLLNLTGNSIFDGNKVLLNATLETIIANNSELRAKLYDEIRMEISNLSSSSMGIGLNISSSDIDALTEALLGPNFVQDGYGSQDWNKFKQILEPYVKQNIKNAISSGIDPVFWTKVDHISLSANYITIENSTFTEDSVYMLQMIFPNWYDGQSQFAGNQGLETFWGNMSEIYANAVIEASVSDYIKFVYNDTASGFGNLFLSVELPTLLKSGKFNTLGAFSTATQSEVLIDLKLMSQVYNYMANNGMQSLLTPQRLASWMNDLLNGVTPSDYVQVINANKNSVTNIGTVTATQTKTIDFISYSKKLDLFNSNFSADTDAWVASLSPVEKSFIEYYTGDYPEKPGNYKSVNAILRGQFTKDNTELTFYNAYSGSATTIKVSDFVNTYKSQILTYYKQIIGTDPYTDFIGSEVDILYQAYLAYQTKAAEVIIQAISKFSRTTVNKGIMLYRKQGIKTISKQFGFTAEQSAEEIFKALTTYPDGSKRDQFVFDSFTSTSINDDSNIPYYSPDSVFFKIKCDESIEFANVMKLSKYGKSEGELLLNAGQYFKIESVEKSPVGNIIINLAPYHSSSSMVNVTAQTVTTNATKTDPLVSALNYLNSGDYGAINSLNLTEAQQIKLFKEALDNGHYSNVVKMASHFTTAAKLLVEKGDFTFLKNHNIEPEVIYNTILHIHNTYGIKYANDVLNTYMTSTEQKSFFAELINQNKGHIVADFATSNVIASRTMLEVGNSSFLKDSKTNIQIKLDAIDYLSSVGKLNLLNGIYVTDSQFAFNLFKKGVAFSYTDNPKFMSEFYNLVVNNIILKQGNKFLTSEAIKLFKSMGYQNILITIDNMENLLAVISNNFTSYKLDSNFVQDGIMIISQILCQENFQSAISIVNNFAINNAQYLGDLLNSNIPVDLKIKLLGNLPANITSNIKFDLATSTRIYNYLKNTSFDKIECCNLLGLDSADSNNHFLAVKQVSELIKLSTRELISIFKSSDSSSSTYINVINLLKQINLYYANMSVENIVKDVADHFGDAQKKQYEIGVDRVQTITYKGININVYCSNHNNLSNTLNRVDQTKKLLDSLPYVLRLSIKELCVYDTNNPFDDYWACEYNKDIKKKFRSAATGGFGQVNIWNYTPKKDIISHELGHCIDSKIYKQIYGHKGYMTKTNSDWSNAIAADGNSVSSYGDNAFTEDFAESVSLFITDTSKFFKKYPNRAKVLIDMFNLFLDNELGFNSKMTRSEVNKRLLEVGFDSNLIKSYTQQGYTIYDIKNAWFRTLMTNESFDFAITAVRSTNNSGELLSKLFGKTSNIVHISDNSQGLIIDNTLSNVSYSQCINSLESAFTTMVNKFGYQETIARFNKYIATGNVDLITRTNDARKIIKSIPVEYVQKYLSNIANPSNNQKFTPKQVETVDFDSDGVADIIKVNEISDDIITSINQSTEAIIIFDDDIKVTSELLSKLNDDVQISYGKSNYVYGKSELIKIVDIVNGLIAKVNSEFTKTETIKFVYDYLIHNYSFSTVGNPDLNALLTLKGTNAAFTEIFYEIMDKLELKGVSVEILKGIDVDGNEVIFNSVRADGLTYLIDSNGFGNINPANIKLISESVLFDSITENDIFLSEKISELIDVTNKTGMNLHESGSQTSNDTKLITPLLQAKADELAKSLFEKASSIESNITEDMKSLAINGSKLIGLEHSLKSIESLSRKILSVHLMSLKTANVKSLESIADEIADSIRYTLVCDESNYVEQVKYTIKNLIDKGYKLKVFRNTWHTNTYKGINTNFIAPDGTILEVQFHTDASYQVKGDLTHIYYEIIRNSFTTKEQKDIACEIREAYQKLITIPEGIIGLTIDDVLPPSSFDSMLKPSKPMSSTHKLLSDLKVGEYPDDPVVTINGKSVLLKGKHTNDSKIAYNGALKHFVEIPTFVKKYSAEDFKSALSKNLISMGYSEGIADAIIEAFSKYANSDIISKLAVPLNFAKRLNDYFENGTNAKIYDKLFDNLNLSPEQKIKLGNDLVNLLESSSGFYHEISNICNKEGISTAINLLKATNLYPEIIERLQKLDFSDSNIDPKLSDVGLTYIDLVTKLKEAKDALMKNAIEKYFNGDNLIENPNADGIGMPIPIQASINPEVSFIVEILIRPPKDDDFIGQADGTNIDAVLFHVMPADKVYEGSENILQTLFNHQTEGIIKRMKDAKKKNLPINTDPESIWEYLSNPDGAISYYINDENFRKEVYNRIMKFLNKESI